MTLYWTGSLNIYQRVCGADDRLIPTRDSLLIIFYREAAVATGATRDWRDGLDGGLGHLFPSQPSPRRRRRRLVV